MKENNTSEQITVGNENLLDLLPLNSRFIRANKSNPTDILEVFKFDRFQSEQFLNVLQQGGTQHIESTADNRRLIQQLYFDTQNQIKVLGQNNLAVAYPFFHEKNGHSNIFCPLFYFQTELEPETASVDTWRFTSSRSKVIFNHSIFNYLEKKYGFDKTSIYTKASQNTDFEVVLKATIAEIAKVTNTPIEYSSNKIFPIQERGGIENDLDEVRLYFNALIGNFETPSPIHVPFQFQRVENQKNTNPKYRYGLFPSDVSQFNALSKSQDVVSVVTGYAGTGKTLSIANLASFALSTGKKILILNNNLKSLLQIQNALAKWNIEKYSFVIKNPEEDKTVLLEILRAIGETVDEKQKKFDAKKFAVKTEALGLYQDKLAASYSHLQKEVPIVENWQNLVGLYLDLNRKVGNEILASQVNVSKFDLEGEEYYELRHLLTKGKALFQAINSLNHPLTNLNSRLFTNKTLNEAKNSIEEQISAAKFELLDLFNDGNKILEKYKAQRRNFYQTHFVEVLHNSEKLSETIEENTKLYGNTYQNPGFVQNLFGGFSDKGKKAKIAIQDTHKLYDELAKNFATNRVFAFNFPKDNNISPKKIVQLLKDFSPKLHAWQTSIPKIIEDETISIQAKTKSDFKEQIEVFDAKLTEIVENINANEIYSEAFEINTPTLNNRIKFIDQTLATLQNTEKDMQDFAAFHPWQSFWLQSDDKEKHLIQGAINTKHDNWEGAFDSWYISQLLMKNHANNFPQNTENQKDIINKFTDVNIDLANQINAVSQNRRFDIISTYRKKSERFNTVFGKNNQKLTSSLQQLFENDFDAVTSCFPITFATVEQAKLLFTKQKFDYLIFDDSQQLDLDSCGKLFQNANQVFVFGDNCEINEKHNSLLYWALSNDFPKHELSIIHTTSSNAMNLFLDSLYPSDSMRIPNRNDDAQFIDIVNVMGRYDEVNNTNSAEAEQVLTLLNSIEKTNLNKYPTIGIITSTLEQRNLIASILLQIKQKRLNGYEKIMQLERNNLGVFHWSEIEGQKFDISILSLTFGIKDTRGKLSEEIQILNSNQGFNYFYQTLTRASQRLIICNSIPYSYFDDFYESHTAKGTFVLSSLIKYHLAIQNNDFKAQEQILLKTTEGLGTVKKSSQNLLIEEIFSILESRISEREIKMMSQIGSLTVPIIIAKKTENEPDVVIRLDGTFTLPYTPDAIWESNFEQQLKESNYQIVDTWSVNWWRNKSGEIERMLEILENIGKENNIDLDEEIDESPNETAQNTDIVDITESLEEENSFENPTQEEIIDELEKEDEPNESERHHDNFTRPSEA